MSLPVPEAGLVIRYSYLWHSDYLEGREEGAKDRPCAIVFSVRADAETGRTRVIVVPVTHREPKDADEAVQIPPQIKKRLGLDTQPSWVVLTEWNEFFWPGPDLRRVPGKDDQSVAHGFLPAKFANHIRRRFATLIRAKLARVVLRP